MKYMKIVSLVTLVVACFIIFETGCRRDKSPVIDRYPAHIGNSWEYSRTFYTVVFDTVNNDTTEHLLTDSLHEEFEIMDTMAGWECYRLVRLLYEQSSTYPQTWWYAHPDTALLWVASFHGATLKSSAGPMSNVRFGLDGRVFDSPRALAEYLDCKRNMGFVILNSDTFYWSPPKKLFVYPLKEDISWIAMTDPWLEEREIVAEESKSVIAGDFSTLKMKTRSDWMTEHDLWYILISEDGIVKDSVHVRDVALDAQGDPIGYWDADDIYELLDFNIER